MNLDKSKIERQNVCRWVKLQEIDQWLRLVIENETSNLNDGFDFAPNRPNQNEPTDRREAISE